MMFLVAHLIGFVGTILAAAGFQCKKAGNLFLVQALASLAYAVHFLMLGWYGGCFAQILVMLNSTLLCFPENKKASWRGWKWLICASMISFTAFCWQGVPSLISCVASTGNTLSNWSRNGRTIRLARLIMVSPLWLLYDIMVLSYSGILCEALTIGSVVLSIRRYGLNSLDQAG